ncbi:MAG: sulfatase-like hydrolase/transferase [Planctomycetes bacterium]|nr:sulfatase-like hydrolase/transferase [Planctomycetota bacterium]
MAAALALAGAALPCLAEERPNIVLIISDDQGYGDASCYGSPDLQTPTMDAMAACGVRVTAFRVNPICAPTRASIMTGLYSLQAGMSSEVHPHWRRWANLWKRSRAFLRTPTWEEELMMAKPPMPRRRPWYR